MTFFYHCWSVHEGLKKYGSGKLHFQINYHIQVERRRYSIHSFLAAALFCSWNESSEGFCFRRWTSSVLNIESQSVWSSNWREKSLIRYVKSMEVCCVENCFFLQTSAVSFITWRVLLRKTRNAAIWNCLLNFEKLAVWLWQPADEVYMAMGRIREVCLQTYFVR